MRSNQSVVTQVPASGRVVWRRPVGPVGRPVPALAHAGAVSGTADGFASLDEAVEAVAAVDALLASLAASRAVLLESVREWADSSPQLVGAEESEPPAGLLPTALVVALATALRLPSGSVLALAEESRALVHEHPRTLAALRGGHITYGHAQTILGYTDGLHRAGRAALETRLLKRSRTCTVGELSVAARAERELRLPSTREPARPPRHAPQRRRQRSSQAGSEPVSAPVDGVVGAS